MDLQELYNAAASVMENLRAAGGSYAISENSAVCVLLTRNGRIYSGFTGTAIENGMMKNSCPEYNAVVSMMTDGETCISKMMTVLFKNGEVVLPCEECRNLIMRINSENRMCEVAISKSGTISLGILMPNTEVMQQQPVQFNNFQQPNTVNQNFQNNPPKAEKEEVQINNNAETSNVSEENPFSEDFVTTDENNTGADNIAEIAEIPEIPKKSKAVDNDFDFLNIETTVESAESIDYSSKSSGEDNPFYEPPATDGKNIVRDGNIEFEMYDPNKKARYSKPKALHELPPSSFNNNAGNTGRYNGSYNTNAENNNNQQQSFNFGETAQHGGGDEYNSGNINEYQSPYRQKLSGLGTESSYYQSQMSASIGEPGDGSSIYKQKLSNLLNTSSSQSQPQSSSSAPAPAPAPAKMLSKSEMMESAKEKKKRAKIDAKFQKKLKKRGY